VTTDSIGLGVAQLRDDSEKSVATAKDSSDFATGMGTITDSGAVMPDKSGAGNWQLGGANIFTGGGTTGGANTITVNGGGSLNLKGTSTPNSITFAGTGETSEKQIAGERGEKADRSKQGMIAAAGFKQLGRDDLAQRNSAEVITGDIGFDVVSNYITKGIEVRNDRHNTVGADAARASAIGEVDKEWARPSRRFDRKAAEDKGGTPQSNSTSAKMPDDTAPADALSAKAADGEPKKSTAAQNDLQPPDADALFKKANVPVTGALFGKRKPATQSAAPANANDSAQQAFVNAFLNVRKAEEQEKAGDLKTAQATLRDALAQLKKIKTDSPHWQTELLDFRIKRTTEAEERVGKKLGDASAEEEAKAEAAKKAEAARKAAEKNAAEAAAKKEAEKARAAEAAAQKPAPTPLEPQPEIRTDANAFSTFSLNVSDVAFKLAAASLEHGVMPDVSTLRTEEFINAFDYRDPEPAPAAPLGFVSERARYPFAQNRDLLRLSVKTAAAGRQPGKPLNVVLLLDNSGSMERADRVRIVREAMRVLSAQLTPQDKLSIVTFSRTPRLWADGVTGDKAGEVTARVGEITPEGGTNLAAALDLGYATALRHYQPGSINHVVVLTDGAANLGNVDPAALKQKVELHRKQGIALDCFGIGWEGLNDDMLEQLSRNGDGRYGFINSPEEAATNFAAQLAGALHVAASDVKVQVEWNPKRVTAYRQIGYAKHQLTKEQFRDNTVDAAELGAAESGNALYVVEVNPRGEGDLATVRVRFKVPGTSDYREHEWAVPFAGNAAPLGESRSTLRLAATSAAFCEMLASSPFAAEVTSDRLLALLNGVPAIYGADPRPQKLEWMIRQAKSISGR